MKSKIDKAVKIIETGLAHAGKPVIAWSGGKDSMALLDLVFNKVGAKMPLVFFREQWQPWKYAFQNRIIEEMGLEVYTWHPTQSNFQQNGDEFEVQNRYIYDNTDMTCPTGITPMEEGKPWVCAMDIYNRPKSQGMFTGWDTMFVGHKRCDSDPIYGGDAGTRVQCRVNPHQTTTFYPIHDWTHDDVFEYCEREGVPIQTDRYEKGEDGKWSESANRDNNCDYVHACTNCIDRRESADKYVLCPKLGLTVENVSQRVMWADHALPSFMKD